METGSKYDNSPHCARLINYIKQLNIPIVPESFRQLLEFLDAPLGLQHIFFSLQEFSVVSSYVIEVTRGPRWRWIVEVILSPAETCQEFIKVKKSITDHLMDDLIFRFTKNPGTTRNTSLALLVKTKPLFSMLGCRPMLKSNVKAYHRLQAQALIAYLSFQREKRSGRYILAHGKVEKAGLDAVRKLASADFQNNLENFPSKPLTPEQYLRMVENLQNFPELNKIKTFIEQSISFSRGVCKKVGRPEIKEIPYEDNHVTDFFSDENKGLKDEWNAWKYLKWAPFKGDNVNKAYNVLSLSGDITYEYCRYSPRQLVQASKAIGKENQRLSFSWSELSQYDLVSLFREITANQHPDIAGTLANAYLHLMLWAGMTSREMVRVQVNSASAEKNVYFTDTGKLRLTSHGPRLSKDTSTYTSVHRICKQDYIDLPLPECAKQAINSALCAEPRLFALPARKVDQLCQARVSTIKRKENAKHLTLSRIRNYHFRRLSRLSKCDISTAALTLGKDDFLARTKIHYASFDSEFLSETFRESCCQMLQLAGVDTAYQLVEPAGSTLNIGTPFRLTKGIIVRTVRKLQKEISDARRNAFSPQGLIRFHNLYSVYTALCVCFSTGHRRAKTPFIHFDEWDRLTGFGCIRDKDTADYQHSRLVWIPKVCARQLMNYGEHLRNLKLIFDSQEKNLQKFPYGAVDFFFIDGNRLDIGYKVFADVLATLGYDFEGHPHRHFLKSELQENGCDTEVLEAFLGHWHTGEEPWVRTSSLHPVDFRAELARWLPSLLHQLDFVPIEGLQTPVGCELNLVVPDKQKRVAANHCHTVEFCKPPGKFWLELFSGRRQATEDWRSVFRTEQLQTLFHLQKHFPKLYDGEAGCQVSASQLEAFIKDLCPSPLHPEKKHRRLHFLNLALARGVQCLGWQTSFPQVPRIIPTERNRIRPSALRRMGGFRRLEAAFLKDLDGPFPADPQIQIGQIALCAFLYGGLLHEKWIKSLPSALLNGKIYRHQGWMWLDLDFGNVEENETSENRFKRQSRPESYRRWFPDPLTQLLICRWREKTKNKERKPVESVWDAISAYLGRIGEKCSRSLRGLLFSVRPYYTLTLPSFLCAYAENNLPSVSMPDQIFLRSLTGEILSTPFQRRPLRECDAVKPPNEYVDEQQKAYFKQFKMIFSDAKNGRDKKGQQKARGDIDSFLRDNAGQLSPILQLLAGWARQLLNKSESEKEKREKAEPFAVSSVHTYINLIGEKLLAICRDQNPLEFDVSEYVAFYERLDREFADCDEGGDQALDVNGTDRAPMGRVEQFHGFLEHFYGEPEIDITAIRAARKAGRKPPAGAISVNLITEQQYVTILQNLGWGKKSLTRLETMTLVATILAYRTGLRKSELHGLTLADVHLVENLEVNVFPNDYRGLKTRSSVRRVPLCLLIHDMDELEFVTGWIRRRLKESPSGITKSLPLFTISQVSEKLVSEVSLLGNARQEIKLVLSDQSVVWHHNRDSFLHTLYFMLLLRDDIPMYSVPHFLQGECFSAKARRQLREQLFTNDASGRKVLFGAATLMGHADIEEGFRSYFHLTDWLLGYYLRHPAHLPKLSNTALMNLTDQRKSKSRVSQWQSSASPLCSALTAYSDTVDSHPLMEKAFTPRRKPGRKIKEKGLPEFDVALAVAQIECGVTIPKSLKDELTEVKDLYEELRRLSLARLKKYQDMCQYVKDSYVEYAHYLECTDVDRVAVLRRLSEKIGITVDLSQAIYHRSRYNHDDVDYRRWSKSLGVELSQGTACQIKGGIDCIRFGAAALQIGPKGSKADSLVLFVFLSNLISAIRK